MSTLRIHGIEAKSDPTSASVNEKIKITNSNGDLLLHLDGTQAGIGTVGIAGTLTYEDVTNIDSVGVITARDGLRVTGIATATAFHGDGSQLTGIAPGSPVGGATTNTVFFENDNSVDVSYTITSGKNAMAAGPIEIKSGITVTVPSGSFLTIV